VRRVTGSGACYPPGTSRRAIRILSVLTYYRPHWTGLTVHAARLAEGLARRGHSVTVLTTRHEASLSRSEVVDGVRVVRLRPLAGFNRGMIVPGLPFALARLLREVDVVQIHTPLPEALLVAGLARTFGVPVLMTHHGDVVMPPSLHEKAIEAAAFVVLSGAARLSSAVTAYSDDYAASSRLLGGVREKVRAIAPPVTLPEPDRAASARWRADLGLTGKTVVGFAGRFVAEKGFDVLLRALPLLRTLVPDVHLVFAGEANVHYERFFEKCRPLVSDAGDRLILLGLLRDPQRIADFHAMCDVFALPSRTEMMALVQVEAMLAGTPVVATDIPGARVVVRETGYGLLCEPGSPESLARTLADALARRADLRPDRARVSRLFAPEESIGRNEQLLGRIVGVAARSPSP
jgi:glycosyltransferase involved in cell wall biosynthesis